jgi:hypothetical protein
VSRSAAVTTDDSTSPAFNLTLSYEAINLLTVDPQRLVLMNFMAGVPSDSREIRVTAQQATHPLNRLEATADRPELTVTVRPVEPGKEFGVTVHASGAFKAGEFIQGNITLKTGFPEQPEIMVPYSGKILGRVRANPEQLQFGVVSRELLRKTPEAYDLSVLLDNPGGGGAKFKLGKIASSDPNVKFTGMKAVLEGQRYELRFRVSADAPAGPLSGTFTIQTSDPQVKSFELPFNGQVE